MGNKNLTFDGLYGENEISLVRGTIHIEPIQLILEKNNLEVMPHFHKNLFQIFYIEEGQIQLHYNNQIIDIGAQTYFTIPKNIVHGITSEKNINGWVLSITDFGLEKTLKLDADIFFNIEEIHIATIDFENPLYVNFYQTYYKCIKEYNDNLHARELALEYLTGMLLIRLFRIHNNDDTLILKENSIYKIIYRRFKTLIKENNSFKHSVEFYAKQLSISPSHLTRICRKVANETPKKIIALYFINEAKVLLTKVDYSISDVAFKLGFDDPSYFTRLFKQTTNYTPRSFRKKVGL
ncbi:AraC family transcriptional regulator, transcriptional activator of pobA [Algoriella xinjiangensis]|uniref:AraC family transcriptional regulator, transcriptional activator of pobA n=1 Tax=Algoriella xinjiangensis TaxID=684065 RepID=A0A1I4YFD3_9FLAO|nr:AraC family transcriptional regulator [Algoriella xinjiangensis]SFN36716.1 AraC family transcriptional regulator, transcriptional activator of pobA [Algoriella xinjiangensis]VDH17321.1 Chb operon repressor [Algoriella xinjiangensis]